MSTRTDEQRAYDRIKYAQNIEHYRKKARVYSRKNKEQRAAYTASYRAANPEKIAEQKKRIREERPHIAAAYAKAYRLRNPEQHKETYKRQNLKKYGLTPELKAEMCEGQNGCCAICGNLFKDARDTHVDHNHSTGIVRGILCSRCNLVLGHAKDSQIILRSAIKYLKKQTDLIVTEYLQDFNFTLTGD